MQNVGRYELLEEIGHGGFGRVYRGYDPVMKRQVAIKLMSRADDADLLMRFRNEAAAAGSLHHENIVTIYDFGEDGGVPYIVMEYLEGQDLQKILDERVSLKLIEKLRILCQVASGLKAAHEAQIIHRDVKPANIMVLKDGAVKIMDFGIARLDRKNATRHTRTGLVVGTLHYMPPEQFDGQPADALADIWAFGVIAYTLFSGASPFAGESDAQSIRRIMTCEIPHLHQRSPDIPEELDAVVGKLLERERTARYQSFEDALIDLNPIVEQLGMEEDSRLVEQARMAAGRGQRDVALQAVRGVLERHPSHKAARELRDLLLAEVRVTQDRLRADDLVKQGDKDQGQGLYDKAMASYVEACKLDPANTSARLRLEHARELAEKAKKARNELNDARTVFAGGRLKEAREMVARILQRDPGNQEARDLLEVIEVEIERRDATTLADALLRARWLSTQLHFDEALAVLEACRQQIGERPELRRVEAEVTAARAQRREEDVVSQAIALTQRYLDRGKYAKAREICEPLAKKYPGDPQIQELLRQAQAGHEMEHRDTTTVETSPGVQPAVDRAAVISRALELSRAYELDGRIAAAIHVLEVALSRLPDAVELAEERQRLIHSGPTADVPPPKVGPVQDETTQKKAQVSAPLPWEVPPAVPQPRLTPAPEVEPAVAAETQGSARKFPWRLGLATGGLVVMLAAGGVYWKLRTGHTDGGSSTHQTGGNLAGGGKTGGSEGGHPGGATESGGAPPGGGPAEGTVADRPPSATTEHAAGGTTKGGGVTETAGAGREVKEVSEEPLKLSSGEIGFAYQRGGSLPSVEFVKVNRATFRPVVLSGKPWLQTITERGQLVISVAPQSLSAGSYSGRVEVSAGKERARLEVTLTVRPEVVPGAGGKGKEGGGPSGGGPTGSGGTPAGSGAGTGTTAGGALPASGGGGAAPGAGGTKPPPPPQGPWQGALTARVTLTCNLAPNGQVSVSIAGVVRGGDCRRTGSGWYDMPPVSYRVTIGGITPAEGVRVALGQSDDQRVVITNVSGGPLTRITFNWSLE